MLVTHYSQLNTLAIYYYHYKEFYVGGSKARLYIVYRFFAQHHKARSEPYYMKTLQNFLVLYVAVILAMYMYMPCAFFNIQH